MHKASPAAGRMRPRPNSVGCLPAGLLGAPAGDAEGNLPPSNTPVVLQLCQNPPLAALNGRDEQGPALGGYTDPSGILSALFPTRTGSLPADSPSSPRGGFFSCCLTPWGEENPMEVARRLQPESKAACLGAGGVLCMYDGVGRKKTRGVCAQPDPQVTSPGCCANAGSHRCPGFPSARR